MKKNIFSTRLLAVVMAVFMLLSTIPAASLASVSAAKASTSATAAKKISKCKITVAASVKYTGKALKPKVKVTDGAKTLKQGKHYTLKYSANKKIGIAKVTVTAVKNSGYTGSKTVSFKIVPAKVTALASSKQTASSISLTWKAVKGAAGYIVYTYDAKTKKYTKVKSLAKTTLTVKKLEAGKKYTFAVRAYTKVDKKTYYGAYSAKLGVSTLKAAAPVTPPVDINVAQVKSLKAAKKGENVVLSWAKVSGADGYQVCTYDASTKKYTANTTVTSNSATIKNLTKQKAYTFAVRAYVVSNGKNVYGDYSSTVTETIYYADMYAAMFKSGTFKATIVANLDDLGEGPITFATKNGNIYVEATIPVTETFSMDAKILYAKKANRIYANILDIWFDATSMMEGDDIFADANIFAALDFGDTSKVTVSTETVGGKKYSVETIPGDNGETVKLYIINGTLARIKTVEKNGATTNVEIRSITGNVPDSLFKEPVGAPDISKLINLLG